jgi:DNA-binding MarR family transcriptional regulator
VRHVGIESRGILMTKADLSDAAASGNILGLIQLLSNLIGPAFHKEIETVHALSIAEWRVILTLMREPTAKASDISLQWALKPMAVSIAIRKLERRGLLARRTSSVDRRSRTLSLTPRGLSKYRAVVPSANVRYREILGCLPKSQRAVLASSLRTIVSHIRAMLERESNK